MEETVAGLRLAKAGEELGRGGHKGRVTRRALFRFREAAGDRGVDLLGEVEVLPGERGKQRVQEVEPAQLGGARHFLLFDVSEGRRGARLVISSTNSETSRNSL